jgi:hypothetical protein
VKAETVLGDLQRVTPWLWLNCEPANGLLTVLDDKS